MNSHDTHNQYTNNPYPAPLYRTRDSYPFYSTQENSLQYPYVNLSSKVLHLAVYHRRFQRLLITSTDEAQIESDSSLKKGCYPFVSELAKSRFIAGLANCFMTHPNETLTTMEILQSLEKGISPSDIIAANELPLKNGALFTPGWQSMGFKAREWWQSMGFKAREWWQVSSGAEEEEKERDEKEFLYNFIAKKPKNTQERGEALPQSHALSNLPIKEEFLSKGKKAKKKKRK